MIEELKEPEIITEEVLEMIEKVKQNTSPVRLLFLSAQIWSSAGLPEGDAILSMMLTGPQDNLSQKGKCLLVNI